jgi:hypothetical protein
MILIMFVGVISFSLVVGSITSLISNIDMKQSILREKIELLDKFRLQYSLTD